MDIDFQRWIDYLDSLGVRDVPHTKHTYFGHLTAVYRYLKQQGCSEDVYKAGLFHSIYGTEGFQEFKLPLDRRDEVRALIGGRAEMLAYLNCAVDRATLDREALRSTPSYHITDRITGDEVTLSREDFDDLCRVHFYDMLEVVPRWGEWNYRRAGYRALAERLGPEAVAEYERVFAREPASQGRTPVILP